MPIATSAEQAQKQLASSEVQELIKGIAIPPRLLVVEQAVGLIALGLVAEVSIQRFARLHSIVEWTKGGDYVAGALVLAPLEVDEWIEQLIEEFATGIA
jgi:hypothetical protein